MQTYFLLNMPVEQQAALAALSSSAAETVSSAPVVDQWGKRAPAPGASEPTISRNTKTTFENAPPPGVAAATTHGDGTSHSPGGGLGNGNLLQNLLSNRATAPAASNDDHLAA